MIIGMFMLICECT